MKTIILIALTAVLAMAEVGQVTVVKGNAYVERDIGDLKAENKMPLLTQDIVQTHNGRLQMQFVDNTVISLGQDSRFRIKEYLYQEESTESFASFELTSGFMKTITGAISKLMPENFVLHTNTTEVISNGTIWSVMVDGESEKYKVMQGSITLNFNDQREQSISLGAGESMVLLIDSKNVNQISKAIKKVSSTSKNINKGRKTSNKVSKSSKNKIFKNNGQKKGFKISKKGQSIERKAAIMAQERWLNEDTTIDFNGDVISDSDADVILDSDGDIIFDDGNNGHGNDPSGVDLSNPSLNK